MKASFRIRVELALKLDSPQLRPIYLRSDLGSQEELSSAGVPLASHWQATGEKLRRERLAPGKSEISAFITCTRTTSTMGSITFILKSRAGLQLASP